MPQLFLTQVSFERGEQNNLYFWEGAFPLKCSQDTLTVSAGKQYHLAPEPATNCPTYGRRQQEKNLTIPQLFTVTLGNQKSKKLDKWLPLRKYRIGRKMEQLLPSIATGCPATERKLCL